jgi:hypothetical protein
MHCSATTVRAKIQADTILCAPCVKSPEEQHEIEQQDGYADRDGRTSERKQISAEFHIVCLTYWPYRRSKGN